MKAYGSDRRDARTCRYGCCGEKRNVNRDCRPLVDKARRKRERQKDNEHRLLKDIP